MFKNHFDWTNLFTGRTRVFVQLSLWILVFLMFIVLKEYPASFAGASLVCIVLQETLELAIPCYTQNLLVLPLFRNRRWLLGISAYLFQISFLIVVMPYLLNAVGMLFTAAFHPDRSVDWRNEHISFSMLAFPLVASAFRLAIDRVLMEKEKRENELRQLKAQLNPHFLFNTLNNLYGLAVVKSDKLPTLMLKLSDLLRYSLYETGFDYVPLDKELSYISGYIELEKIRLEATTRILFETAGDATGKWISPLILMTFIENAFKHFSAPRNEVPFIEILIRLTDTGLRMSVRNSLDPLLYLRSSKETDNTGIGMDNVRGRLQLLYPQAHHITVSHVPDGYSIDLEITLSR